MNKPTTILLLRAEYLSSLLQPEMGQAAREVHDAAQLSGERCNTNPALRTV